MKVLVIGGGGREHAIVWKLRQSPRVSAVHCSPGNAGIARESGVECMPLSLSAPFDEVALHCRREKIDFVIVGPEAPLVSGLADAMEDAGIPCFGACWKAAQLEGSKAFTRKLMAEAGVPSHGFEIFEDAKAAQDFYRSRPERWWIKADGLAAGKGAVMPASIDEGCALLAEWLEGGKMGEAGKRVVIEEPLTGTEVSVIAFAQGETVRCLAPSQDHKRLLDGDQGPNTGGMGAFAPSPTLSETQRTEIERDFLLPTLRALRKGGIELRGFLYAGMMMTPQGPRLLEYNVRLGDPEAQVILPMMENDLVDVVEAAVEGRLADVTLKVKPGAAVTVVAASEGYPASPKKGDAIEGLAEAESALGDDGKVFHAGTKEADGKIVTSGGRVLAVTARGSDMRTASDRAYEALGHIRWAGLQHRSDIAR
jgi:phosphoribosylamine---glycine ligase